MRIHLDIVHTEFGSLGLRAISDPLPVGYIERWRDIGDRVFLAGLARVPPCGRILVFRVLARSNRRRRLRSRRTMVRRGKYLGRLLSTHVG